MKQKVKFEKIISFKHGTTQSTGKEWQVLEVLVSYEKDNFKHELAIQFSGKSDIGRVECYVQGTIFETDLTPKSSFYEKGNFYITKIAAWGSLTEQNMANYQDIRNKEVPNAFAAAQPTASSQNTNTSDSNVGDDLPF